jgi:hypothetical protein
MHYQSGGLSRSQGRLRLILKLELWGNPVSGKSGVSSSFLGKSGGKSGVLQPIMPLDLPVKVRPWELTVYPRSHIRR